MKDARRSSTALGLVAVLVVGIVAGAAPERAAGAAVFTTQPRFAQPEDRFAMAGGCYGVRSYEAEAFIARGPSTFVANARELDGAEPFHFQATDLGSYLLFGTAEDFLAASEGALADAVYGITRSNPGQIVGGVALEQTDAAADVIARSPLNAATGRGASVVIAERPSELADWEIDQLEPHVFSLRLPSTDQVLSAGEDGSLSLVPADQADTGARFGFELTTACATYPEIDTNVLGEVVGGDTPFEEVQGYIDLHLHMMAFEFLGGRVRCGRPWHRYGVAYALVDCPDHEPNGEAAVLEQVLSGGGTHDTDGWPTFAGWPRAGSLIHEQIYYKWLERAWRGGLRLFTNLLVDNHALCEIYPFKRNSCNEMDGVRLQARRIHELQDYIDAQNGGPGEGWFRIVTDPFEARRVINQGRLAVVLGIEVSIPLDCAHVLDVPLCERQQVDERLDEVYDLGVRQMELVNKFDNAFSGVTGDGGTTGIVVNQGNRRATGYYWRMETCDEHEGEATDKTQLNLPDDSPLPEEITGRDALAGAILQAFGPTGAAPLYPEGPHCNTQGLTDLGEYMIRGMVERGMIFDPDHMSARARTAAMDLLDEIGYSGVASSHSWADDTIYPRVYARGGVVTPSNAGAERFVDLWRQHKAWADPRFTFGFGYGADTNGFSGQPGPRGANVPNPVTYPFTGLGGVQVYPQQSGTRTYDVNSDGVAHYGLHADWMEDLRIVAGADGPEMMADMARGAEAFLQTWERSIGIAGDACRDDIDDLTDERVDALTPGTTVEQVLGALGQPSARVGTSMTFCMTGSRTATAGFDAGGVLTGIVVA